MLFSVLLSHRSKLIYFCVLCAIIISTNARFRTWQFNPTYKLRPFNANSPSSISNAYHQWPSVGTRRSLQFRPNNSPTRHRNTYQQNVSKKPTASICRRAGYFVYPHDCKKFYRCVATQQIASEIFSNQQRFTIFHFVCPGGTIFDERIQVCNHPWATICKENDNNLNGDMDSDMVPTEDDNNGG